MDRRLRIRPPGPGLLIGLLGAALSLTSLPATPCRAGTPASAGEAVAAARREGELLLKFRSGTSPRDVDSILADLGAARLRRFHRIGADHVRLSRLGVDEAVARYRGNPAIEFIEPNYLVRAEEILPNDPLFPQLWALRNVGQAGGTPGADIRAAQAWALGSDAGGVIVGIIDTGVDFTHPDLAENAWRNTGEIPSNGLDDDRNGYIDDVFGYDFRNLDSDPMDDNGHGTHVAGTVGATGNNGIGVTGVAWRVRIMPLKFLSSSGAGYLDGAVAAIEYGVRMGARVLNNSWGGGPYSEALHQAILDADAAGVVVVAAAGNAGTDNDIVPHYPSGYDLPNVVSVAASTDRDALAGFSNHGAGTVDLAAPGVQILSTIPGSLYGWNSGTSMSAPHVSGALALLLARYPAMDAATARTVLLSSVDPVPGLAGFVVSGGRLNVARMLEGFDSTPPSAVVDLLVTDAGSNRVTLRFTAPGDDAGAGRASAYDLRYATTPIDTASFASAARALGLPKPDPAGTPEEVTVQALSARTIYHFALRTRDEYGNESALSNVATGATLGPPDLEASPASFADSLPTGLSVTRALHLRNAGEGTLDFVIAPEEAGPAVTVHASLPLEKGAEDPRVGDPAIERSGGPDRFGYRWSDNDETGGPVFEWVDIRSVGERVDLSGDDEISSALPIGFVFPFYGVDFTTVRVCTNGYLSFTSTAADFGNQPLPGTGAPENLIAVLWDDLLFDATVGSIHRYFDGTRLIVQFSGATHFGGGGPYTFQAILYPTGEIRLQYLEIGVPTSSATIGIQNGARDDGLTVAFNSPYLRPGLAVRIAPSPRWLSVRPGRGTVLAGETRDVDVVFAAAGIFPGRYRASIRIRSNDPVEPDAVVPAELAVSGAPDIAVAPDALSLGSVFIGTTRRAGVAVTNAGSLPLDVVVIPPASGAYGVDAAPFTLLPGERRAIAVRFAPTAPGSYEDTIRFRSNDPDEPEVVVPIHADALPPPDIAVSPTSFEEHLISGTKVGRTLNIANEGPTELSFRLVAEEDAPAAASLAAGPDTDAGASPPPPIDAAAWAAHRAAGPAPKLIVAPTGSVQGATLPAVVIDPNDDGGETELSSLHASTRTGALEVELRFATVFNPYDFGGFLSLDTDQDPSTGVPPSFGNGRQVIGTEYEFLLFTVGAGYVVLMNRLTGQPAGTFAATHDDHAVRFAAPLSALGGDEGRMDVTGVVGTASIPSDWFPDDGHGTIGTVTWVTAGPQEGRVPPGGRVDVALEISAVGLLDGNYRARIRVESNDPDELVTLVPLDLWVTGIPEIAAALDTLDFGTVYVGTVETRVLRLTNEGTGPLSIRGAFSDNPAAFLVDLAALTLGPGERADLEVLFLPTEPGAAAGALHVLSDDPDAGDFTVACVGAALEPPDIDVESGLLHADLLTGATATGSLTVRNSGRSDLRLWSATRRGAFPAIATLPVSASAAPEGATRTGDPSPVFARAAALPGRSPSVLVVQSTLAWGVDLAQLLVESYGISATMVSAEALAETDLALYDVILTGGDEDGAFYTALSASAPRLERFVERGGILQYDVATQGDNVFLAGGAQAVHAYSEIRNRVLLPNHPIATNLPLLLEGPYINHCVLTGLPAGVRVITETAFSRRPTTVEYRIGRGTVIATGMTWEFLHLYGYPAGVMLTQSISHALSLVRPSWLGIAPGEAVIPPGGSATFAVEYDAAGLLGGDYTGLVEFESNDLDESLVRVPAGIHVTGAPDVGLGRGAIAFGPVFVGGERADTIAVRNDGSDRLLVMAVTTDRPAFRVSLGSVTLPAALPPGGRLPAVVRFAPTAAEAYAGTLTVDSDDPDEPRLTVSLDGQGIPPPVARITPDSLEVALRTGETGHGTLSVSNAGGSDLAVALRVRRGNPPPLADAQAPAAGVLVIQNTDAWGIDLGLFLQEHFGIDAAVINSREIAGIDFSAYALVVTSGDQDAGYYFAVSSSAARFERFAAAGGVVVYLLATNASGVDLPGGARVEYGMREPGNRVAAPGHPIVAGRPDLLQGFVANNGQILHLPAAARVITETEATRLPTTAEYAWGQGHVVVTAMPWEQFHGTAFNAAPLLRNALGYAWVLARPAWIRAVPAGSSLRPGATLEVGIDLDATGLEAGAYEARVDVATNDPLVPVRRVPARLRVTGVPLLAAAPEALDFGPVFVGTTRTLTLTLRNPGTAPVRVARISADDPAYAAEPDSLELPAYSQRAVEITFAPGSGRPSPAALRFEHDAPGSPLSVALSGEGVPPPVLSLPVESVSANLPTGGTDSRGVAVENRGGSGLEFTAEPRNGAPAVAMRESLPLAKGVEDPRPGEVSAAGEGGPDRYGYRWVDSDQPNGARFSWTDIRFFGAPIPLTGDDQISAAQQIGFEFPFYGRRFSQFRVCTNGWISFTSTAKDFANQPLPSPGAPGNLLAPFWDDLTLAPGSSAIRLYDGTRLIIQFNAVLHYGAGGPYTFQIVLYPSGAIQFQYLTMGSPTDNATIGIQNEDGTDGVMAAFNAAYLHDHLAIRFSPAPDWLAVSPAMGTVPAGSSLPVTLRVDAAGLFPGDYLARVRFRTNDPFRREADLPVRLHVRGVPDLAVSPASLDFDTVYVGQRAERPLTLTNAGTAPLTIAGIALPAGAFHAGTAPSVLAPLESATLAVSFEPAAPGAQEALLEIASDDPGAPARIPLSATALEPPEASLLPVRLAAAAPPAGAADRSLSLGNGGGSDLRFTAASGAPWIVVAPAAGAVAAGESLQLAVQLDASSLADGDHGGSIEIATNDPAHPLLRCDVRLHVGVVEAAAADIEPNTLNLESNGRFVLAHVELPPDLDPATVVPSSLRFLDVVAPARDSLALGDFNRNGIPDLEIRFSRAAVEAILPEADSVEARVTGEVRDRTWFVARDTIRTIRPRLRAPNGGEVLAAGAPVEVRWEDPAGVAVERADVLVSLDNGATWTVVVSGASGGRASWTPPPGNAPAARLRVVVHDARGPLGWDTSDGSFAIVASPTAVAEEAAAPPARHALHAPSPNPFGPSTAIAFDLPRAGRVRLRIFDAEGRLVRILAEGALPGGRHRARWDGRTGAGAEAASGVYFARLDAGAFHATRRMLLLR